MLASGDPMWYGVGVTLSRRFPREEMTIVPQPSAFSLAAARLGWPLADCATITLHGRPLDTLRLHLAPHRRILILSEDGGTPREVAELLTELGWGPSRLTVLAHLGGSRETIIAGEAHSWGDRRVPDLNTIAIACIPGRGARALPRLAGLPDDAFEHDGQLTKREVRAATLAALAPLPGETLWDIGAGCGSIAIEWLRAGEGRSAIAIERDPARAAMIARNAAALGVPELRIVPGAAPEALKDLPRPRCDLHRRRDRRGRFAGTGMGQPAARRAPRRERRHHRGRGAASRLACPTRRGADPHRGQPRRAGRAASSVAAAGDGDPARRRQAGLKCGSFRFVPAPTLPLTRVPPSPVLTGEGRGGGWSERYPALCAAVSSVPDPLCARARGDPAARPRRSAFRAGDAADAGDRRFHPHPLPGRGAQQEADRDLLAAGGRRRGIQLAGKRRDLALSPALGIGGNRRGAADLRLRRPAFRARGRPASSPPC